MKNIIAVLVMALVSVTSFAQAKEHFLIPEKVNSEIDQVKFIDVRTPEEYKEGSIPKAININIKAEYFKDNIDNFKRDEPIVIFCQSGTRSAQAYAVFKELGFTNVREIEGGYEAWQAVQKK